MNHGSGSRAGDIEGGTGGGTGNTDGSGDDLRASTQRDHGKKGEDCDSYFHGDIVPFFIEMMFTFFGYDTHK